MNESRDLRGNCDVIHFFGEILIGKFVNLGRDDGNCSRRGVNKNGILVWGFWYLLGAGSRVYFSMLCLDSGFR